MGIGTSVFYPSPNATPPTTVPQETTAFASSQQGIAFRLAPGVLFAA